MIPSEVIFFSELADILDRFQLVLLPCMDMCGNTAVRLESSLFSHGYRIFQTVDCNVMYSQSDLITAMLASARRITPNLDFRFVPASIEAKRGQLLRVLGNLCECFGVEIYSFIRRGYYLHEDHLVGMRFSMAGGRRRMGNAQWLNTFSVGRRFDSVAVRGMAETVLMHCLGKDCYDNLGLGYERKK
jgi:hypothetical protein